MQPRPGELLLNRRDDLERSWHRWEPASLVGWFDRVAARHGDRPLVISDQGSFSYREIAEWSAALARGLIALGIEAGEPVALLADNRAELVAAKLAVARAGAVAVPLNYQYRPDELAAALAHSGAVALVTIARSMATDFVAALDEIVPGWEREAAGPRVPRLRHVVVVDPVRDAISLSGLVERGRRVPEAAVRTRCESVDPDGVCDVVFTSGTSGRPVAAALTHDMLLRSAYGSAYHRGFGDGWRSCFALPLYHVFGYVEGLLAVLFVGGAVVPRQVFNPATMLEAIQQHRAHEVLCVPTMTVALVEQAARAGYDLSACESVFSAAAPAPVWLWQRVQQTLAPRVVFTGYGQTEVSAATALTGPGDPLEVVAETVGCTKLGGIAAAGEPDGRLATYRTVDPFTGTVLPAGSEGELAVRGPIVTRGYHHDPQRTAELIDPDGWLRTGDLGRIGEDGYLRLTGRARELFKVGGELVAPKEVEDALTRHPGVGQAYVAGVPDRRMGEVGWAWVVPDDTADLDERGLIRYCHAHLAPFKVPRVIRIVGADDLPKTSTGKVQKFKLVRSAGE